MPQQHIQILLVANSSSDTQLVRRMLEESWGDRFTITQVQTLSEAVLNLSQGHADVTLVDLGMPEVEELEMIHHLREAVPSVPIIVLTENDREEAAVHAIQVGAQDYILKGQLVGKRLIQAIGYAIARQVQIKSYKTAARTDSLTNTLNRRAFDQQCAIDIESAMRNGTMLSCALLDIDRFKEINDVHGHLAGDAVLRSVTDVLCQNARQSDLICRYGGDEFCVVLADADEQQAACWAERVRANVAELQIPVGNGTASVRVAIGVGQWREDIATPQDLVNLADQALLTAKNSGRDRVVRYSALSETESLNDLVDSDSRRLLGAVQASDVMTTPIVCLAQTAPLHQAADFFLRMRINSAPVVDAAGRLSGIISEKDLLVASLGKRSWDTPIEAVMTSDVVAYDMGTPAVTIWEFLARVTIRRVVVIDQDRVPVGVISRGSLLRWIGNWGMVFEKHPSETEREILVPNEGFRRGAAAIEQQISRLTEDLTSDSSEVVVNVVHAATRIQEHVQDLLALSQITYQFDPDVVIGAWNANEANTPSATAESGTARP